MKKEENENTVPYTGKTYAYIAIALTALGAVALVLGIVIPVLGIYALIASMLLELAALTFSNVQKRKNDFNKLKIINIFAYAVLIVCVAIFCGGIIWSAI